MRKPSHASGREGDSGRALEGSRRADACSTSRGTRSWPPSKRRRGGRRDRRRGRPSGRTRQAFLRPLRGWGPTDAEAFRGRGSRGPFVKGLILAQNERWRRGLGMQVERAQQWASGGRVSKATATNPGDGYSRGKLRVMPSDARASASTLRQMDSSALGRAVVVLGRWRGSGPPSLRCLPGVRARPGTLGLRHCPDSYGRLQSRIFGNGRKPDRATSRGGRRPSGCKLLSRGGKVAQAA